MIENRPGRGSDKFPLRFPDGMRDAIKEAAARNGRTMNAEIISRLELSFAREVDRAMGTSFEGRIERKLDELADAVTQLLDRRADR